MYLIKTSRRVAAFYYWSNVSAVYSQSFKASGFPCRSLKINFIHFPKLCNFTVATFALFVLLNVILKSLVSHLDKLRCLGYLKAVLLRLYTSMIIIYYHKNVKKTILIEKSTLCPFQVC